MNQDTDKWANDFDADGHEECSNYFVRFNPVFNASSVLFRKEVYDRVGGADETLRSCGDWKLWAAMALQGRIAHVKEPLNYYRVHGRNVTEESMRGGLAAAEYLRVIRWILSEVTPTEAARQKLSERFPGVGCRPLSTWRVPLRRRLSILRDAAAIDPHILRQVIPAGLSALRRKFIAFMAFYGLRG